MHPGPSVDHPAHIRQEKETKEELSKIAAKAQKDNLEKLLKKAVLGEEMNFCRSQKFVLQISVLRFGELCP